MNSYKFKKEIKIKKKNFESKLLKFRSELEVLNKEEMQDAFGGGRYGSSGGGGGGPADGGVGSYGGVSVGPTFAGGANGGGSATSVAMSTYVSPADTSSHSNQLAPDSTYIAPVYDMYRDSDSGPYGQSMMGYETIMFGYPEYDK